MPNRFCQSQLPKQPRISSAQALIFEHGQYGTGILIENTVSTASYSYTDVFKIINEGDYFELKPEVDMRDHEEA